MNTALLLLFLVAYEMPGIGFSESQVTSKA